MPPPVANPAAVCFYTVGGADRSFGADGGTGSIMVTAAAGCRWTAVVGKASRHISITSGAVGEGHGAVQYTVAANMSGAPRSGTINIAGRSVYVSQAAGRGGGPLGRRRVPQPQTAAKTPADILGDLPSRQARTVKGFADLHTHHMGHLAFDGEWLHGSPDGPVAQALPPCSHPAHLLAAFKPKTESHLMTTQGHPSFRDWPKWNNIGHQAMHESWVRKAHEQGLTLMVLSFTSFEPQCRILKAMKLKVKEFKDLNDLCSDMRSVRQQIAAAREFDRAHDWYEIVTTPEDARRAIHENRLAVVMAIEVSNLFPEKDGPWRRQLDEMERLGVVSIQPVHELDNRFGKAALHKHEFRELDLVKSNKNLGVDQTWVENLLGFELPADAALTDDGEALVDAMMKKGMLVDIAHLDPKGTDEVFEIARRNNFAPIFLSHTYFADLMPPIYKDWNKHVTRRQVSQIKQTGGMVGLRTGPDEQLTYRPAGIENNCHGSSRSFAQRHAYATLGLGVNVGLASDQNGLIENAGPRFAGNQDSCMWAYHECKYTAEKKKLGVITYDRVDCDLSVWEDEGKLQQAAQGGPRQNGLGNDFDAIGLARTDHLDDLLADLRKLGADTTNIESSSESFIRMWERARSGSRQKLAGDVSIPPNAIEPYREKEARKDWIKAQKDEQSCRTDQDCGAGNFCDTGTLTLGRNVCKRKLNDGQLCTTGRACASGTCDVRCIRPNSQPMGGSCYVNAECREGKCSAALFGTINGKCVCDSDAECSGSQYCYKGFADIGTNECRAKKRDGQACLSAGECSGGGCKLTCFTPASKAFGQSCDFNAECRQGTCSAELLGLVNGSCVCTQDSHCGAGNYCNTGVAGIGTNDCRPKLSLGQACSKDHQCKSNRCSLFKCKN